MDWTLYDTFINTNGSTPRDRKINELKNSLNKKLENSANCRTVKINNVDKKLMVLKTDLYNKVVDYFIIMPYKRKKAYRFLFTNRMIY